MTIDFDKKILRGKVRRLGLPVNMIKRLSKQEEPSKLLIPLPADLIPKKAQVRRSIETGEWEWITGDADPLSAVRHPLKSPFGTGGGEWQSGTPLEGLCFRRWTAHKLAHLSILHKGKLVGDDVFFCLCADGDAWAIERTNGCEYRAPGKILYLHDREDKSKRPETLLEIEAFSVDLVKVSASDLETPFKPKKMEVSDLAWVVELKPLTEHSGRCLSRLRKYIKRRCN